MNHYIITFSASKDSKKIIDYFAGVSIQQSALPQE